MPRKPVHASNAERQRAYRMRKAQAQAQARAAAPAPGSVVLSAAEAAQVAHHLNIYANTYSRPPAGLLELIARLGGEYKPRPTGLVLDL